MPAYISIDKVQDKACSVCCCKRESSSAQSSLLTRRFLITVLVVCFLAVTLLVARWTIFGRTKSFSESGDFRQSLHCCSDPDELYNTSAARICTFVKDGSGYKCLTVKPPQTTAVSGGLENSSKQDAVAAEYSAPCPASAAAQLAEDMYSDNDLPIRRLPQCLIIGVRKGGTRALLEFLNLHPDVQAERREMHFFDKDNRYKRGLEWYRRQMHASHRGQITMEKTPAYFVEDEVASRVHQMNASIRLLVTFRDPVERAISDYLQIQEQREANGRSRLSFEHLVIDSNTGEIDDTYQAVWRSMYDVHLTRWLRYFSLEQFHFLGAENFIANPAEELRRVEIFLGLRHKITKDLFYFSESRGFYCMCFDQRKRETNLGMRVKLDGKCLSPSKGRTHPSIDPHVLRKLREFFRPHNKRLYQMTGIDFGWK